MIEKRGRINYYAKFKNKFINLVDSLCPESDSVPNDEISLLANIINKICSLKTLTLKWKNDLVWRIYNDKDTRLHNISDDVIINLCKLRAHLTYTSTQMGDESTKNEKLKKQTTKLIIKKHKAKSTKNIIYATNYRKINFYNLDNTYDKIMNQEIIQDNKTHSAKNRTKTDEQSTQLKIVTGASENRKSTTPQSDTPVQLLREHKIDKKKKSNRGRKAYTAEQQAAADKLKSLVKERVKNENEKRSQMGKPPLKDGELRHFKRQITETEQEQSEIRQPLAKRHNLTFFTRRPDLAAPVSGDDLDKAIEKIASVKDKKCFPEISKNTNNNSVQVLTSFRISNKSTSSNSSTATSSDEDELSKPPETLLQNTNFMLFDYKDCNYKEQIERNKIKTLIIEKGLLDPINDKQKIELLVSQ